MRVALLSDAHLMGPDDPNQRLLSEFLRTLAVDRLYLLGDIFQHWWHFGASSADAAPFAAYAPVVEILRAHSLSFVPGNHDFHAPTYFRDALGAEVGGVLTPTWDGLRAHLSHGDGVDESFGYRAASAVLRGRPFAALLDRVGPERAWRILRRIAGTPGGEPDPRLVALQRAQASDRMAEGFGLVVVGHTHAPCVEIHPAGVFVNLGDWVRWHTWLLVEDGRPSLMRRLPDGTDVPFVSGGVLPR